MTHREEAETDTYELTEHAANVPLGTSSSRVTARFGAGMAVAGAGTSGGKTQPILRAGGVWKVLQGSPKEKPGPIG